MAETVDTLATKIDALGASVDKRFVQVNQRFEHVGQRFEKVDRQFTELRQQIAADTTETCRLFTAQIAAEGEKTRRHFDVVAEQMKAERNLSLDKSMATDQQLARLTASNAADHVLFQKRLEDHEQRLTDLEKK